MSDRRRALVLGSGGLTGLAWEAGVLAGLAREGVDLDADVVVGTSAGALLAARLTSGATIGQVAAELGDGAEPPGARGGSPHRRTPRLAPAVLARLLAAQLYPSRRHALAWLGRRAGREWTAQTAARWVDDLAGDLSGHPWPAPLVVVATDAASGRPAFLSAGQPADLAAAVAASCALPGVFPAVRVDDQLLFDGGLRSPANLDVAGDADVVLALAPLTRAVRAHRRPADQAAQLRRTGATVVLVTPDPAGRRAIGIDVLARDRVLPAFDAGVVLGARRAAEVVATWH